MKRSLFVIALIIGAGVWYYNSKNPSLGTAGAPWEEVSVADFDSRVLKSPLPALVYFDAVEGCDGADVVFTRLR